MAISSIHPAYAINKFLWAQIETEGIMAKTDYATPQLPAGIVPIVPVQETPELLQVIESQQGIRSLPYIVFTWSKINTGQAWFIKTHEIAYAIRSADDLKMRKLINLFDELFKDYDMAAHRVNAYVQANGLASHKAYHFKTISVSTLGGQMPTESENDVNESLITIRATFSGE